LIKKSSNTLLLLGACKKDYDRPAELSEYPSSIISTPIITTNIPLEVSEFQTPINISTFNIVPFFSIDPIVQYGTIKLSSVENNEGENLKINVDPADRANNYITIKGKKYNLAQFHFHYHSEHAVNGNFSTMEIHFVNIAADNSYAVIGVLVDLGTGNNTLQSLFAASPSEPHGINSPNTLLKISDLLPINKRQYFTYNGSLTTPNFGGNSDAPNAGPVTWIIYKNTQQISQSQFGSYKAIYHEDNSRNLRPLNGRKVYFNPGN
jgi:carbonic anhydrase